MIVFTRRDLAYVRPALRERLGRGGLGLFPTDGGYALFGNALSPPVRRQLARWRARGEPPVMVPHALEWARLVVAAEHRPSLDDLVARHTGKVRLVFRHSGPEAPLPPELAPDGRVTLQFPRHWVRDLASQLTFPLLCLPVPGGMTRLEELPAAVARALDFIVYEGPRPAVAPTVVRLDAPPDTPGPGGPAPCQAPPTSGPSKAPRASGRGRSAARRGTSRSSGRSPASRSRPAPS